MSDGTRTVGEVIDEIPVGRFHHRMLVVTGLVWATIALEVLIISFTLPTFRAIWGLSSLQVGLLGSAGLLGMIFGNSIGGWYADQFGRKRALMGTVAFFSVWTGLTALATGFHSAFALRFLAGLGVGGAVAVDASYLTEHIPSDRRGRYLAYLELFFAVGNLLTVLLAAAILPAGQPEATLLGVPAWRVFYAVAAAPIMLVAVVHYAVGESPYYLAASGDFEGASRRLDDIAAENGTDLAPSTLATREDSATGFARLFAPDVRRTTLLAALLWFGLNFGYYGVFIWLPDTVQAAGYVGGFYTYLLAVMAFQVLGVAAAAVVVDRIGRRATLAISFTMTGLSTALFATAIPGVDVGLGIAGRTPFLAGLFATGFFIFAIFATLFVYTTELFPTEVRSTGLGFTSGVGKVAAVVGPVLVGVLVEVGYLAALAPFAASLVLAGVVVGAFGRETLGESLV